MAEETEKIENVEKVNHPQHYNNGSIECIVIVRNMGFDLGSAVKYLWRFEDKNGIEDLQKAIWYLRDIKSHQYLTGMFHYTPIDALVIQDMVKHIENEAIKGALSIILNSLSYLTESRIDDAIRLIEHGIELENEGVKSNEERRTKKV